MNIISYGLRTGFSKAIIALKDTKQFSLEVKSAAARVMFSSASVGGLSWSALFGIRNDLRLEIARALFEHGDLPQTGPINISEFITSEERVKINNESFSYDPGTTNTHTWKEYGSYVVTLVHKFIYKGKVYPLQFGPIYKANDIHYDYSLKGDYNPF